MKGLEPDAAEPTATWQADQREFIVLIDRAQAGDRSVLPELDQLLQHRSDIWKQCGDLAHQAEEAWVTVCAGTNLLASETLKRHVAALKDGLLGQTATPLERLLIDRIAVCWLQVHAADLEVARTATGGTVAQVPTPHVASTRLDSANHRYLAAMKQLALVRKLLPPAKLPRIRSSETSSPVETSRADASCNEPRTRNPSAALRLAEQPVAP